MNPVESSVIALIVAEDRRADLFERNFRALLQDHTTDTLKLKHQLSIERFRSVSEFLKAQSERRNLSGTIIDLSISSDNNEAEKRALAMIEELRIPVLKVSEKFINGDAVDRKLLLGKWGQLMEQIEAFVPRGLRIHSRKLAYIKVRYHEVGKTSEGLRPTLFESRAITFDVSSGGCFIVSTEDWSKVEHLSIFVGDYPDPIPCRIAWRLPWGSSRWKMPGIGVEFAQTDEKLKTYLHSFMKKS